MTGTKPIGRLPAHRSMVNEVRFYMLGLHPTSIEESEYALSRMRTCLDLINKTSFPPEHIEEMITRLKDVHDWLVEQGLAKNPNANSLLKKFTETIASLETLLSDAMMKRTKLETMREGPDCPKCNFTMINDGGHHTCPNCEHVAPGARL